ncbi:Type I Iterative PKS [Diaporthe australafricana]|uniref:Type I Iterative PKS n=1 Tax=Diaporthe australafricana TaxID=127596 RepID=A0ABR3XNC1_9PEZI
MAPSLAVFCPQSKAPQRDYLSDLRNYICAHQHLGLLAEQIQKLDKTWHFLASKHQDLESLGQGPRYMRFFSQWITEGRSDPLANVMSGIISLPLLVIIQVTQYFQFLEISGTTHAEFLDGLKGNGGGMQGYCAGLLPAFAIACAKDETDVIVKAANAMRIALAIGAYGELGDDASLEGPTTLVVRLKQPGQGEELVNQFPGAYISAITDPKTISVVGPVATLERLSQKARDQGLLVSAMHIRGKVHNPENLELAAELAQLCQETESLQLPSSADLQVAVNSNLDGRPLQGRSLTREAVYTILASKCEWYKLLENLASSLVKTRVGDHEFALFGIGDPVPLAPFHQAQLRVTKVDVYRKVRQSQLGEYSFNSDAIAIVGSSCRLPGANNLEELWDLMATGTSKVEEIRPSRIPIHANFRASQDTNKKKKTFFGNFVDDVDAFDYAFFKSNSREAASMDPQQRLLLEVAYEAMDSSGYLRHHKRQDFDRVGCFIGGSFTEYLDNTSSHAPTAYTSTGTIKGFLCGRISYYFGWSGPAEVIDTACSSSLVAIHRACQAIRAGECSSALTGGVNIMSGVQNFLDLSKAGFLSPTGQCKPFDAAADGYARSDGVGLIVLKPLADARRDGDQVLGVITGVATNQGALSSSITVPHSPSQIDLYRRILSQSGMTPDHVTYVEAHGTGTQAGKSTSCRDPLEIASIRSVFGGSDRVSNVHVGSLKGNIGHAETAAGVAGVLKILAMLSKSSIPPLASHKSLNPKIPALTSDKMVLDKAVQSWDMPIRVACVNSYGAAGSNAALLCAEDPSSLSRRHAQLDTPSTARGFAVPVIISAATKESLLLHCKDLDAHLDRNPQVDIGDVAFTLAERRKRHRFALTTTVTDVTELRRVLQSPSEIREVPAREESKGVILAFSGQSKQSIGLDLSLYKSSPRLRAHIQECDALLSKLGFPSILPSLFETSPVSEVIVLQTGTFAVQYASARCWIESGLKVDACIGHSFGELTALVVSGVLSLQDGLKLVATRASLMKSAWGPERGTMLLIHSTKDMVHGIIDRIGKDLLEIACYNAKESQVVVGSAQAIAQVEDLIKSEPGYSQTKAQRLDVSHGFHSRFTEPLLVNLSAMAETLDFNHSPSIHLETCTAEPSTLVGSRYLTRHTRNAVHFADAVHRLEARFGDCTWLEAGQGSPIIGMIKRAADKPGAHQFYSLRSGDGNSKRSPLSTLTTDLWNDGLDTAFWPFLKPTESDSRQVWLPPYRFTKTRAWINNIDRATELQELLTASQNLASSSVKKVVTPIATPVLVSLREKQGPKAATFTLHTNTERFSDIVKGHAVRNRALCPASMYMESATMAMQILQLDLSGGTLCFEGVHFESPLGVDSTRQVILTVKETASSGSWKFGVASSANQGSSSKLTTHGKGTIVLGSSPSLGAYQRIATERVQQLESKPGTETLMAKRAYGLFSQVVTYADFLCGILSITMDGHQAVADIKIPSGHVGERDSTAIDVCDTVAIDNFIQVVGLLINSSDHCAAGQVFVATGVETAILSLGGGFLKSKAFKVYAMYTLLSDTQATGDIFIMQPDYTLVGVILGASFTRLPITTLEKLLDAANKNGSAAAKPSKTVAPINPLPVSHVEDLGHATLDKDWAGDSGYSSEGVATPVSDKSGDENISRDSLIAIICEYTGASSSSLSEDDTMAALGVDSLASTEMASELQAQFGKEVPSEELMQESLRSLSKLLIGSSMPHAPGAGVKKQKLLIAETTTIVDTTRPVSSNAENVQKRSMITGLIAEMAGAQQSSVTNDITLGDLGVDSLAAVQLKGDLETALGLELGDDDFHLAITVEEVYRLANAIDGDKSTSSHQDTPQAATTSVVKPNSVQGTPASSGRQDNSGYTSLGDPADALRLSERDVSSMASSCGYESYWSTVGRKQDEILVAYILEAYKQLGVDLWSLPVGANVQKIDYLPKHEKVMQRFQQMLQKHGIIERTPEGSWVRTARSWPSTTAQELSARLLDSFPRYKSEIDLMSVTGPKLAGCLTGRDNPVALLFSNKGSQKILEEYYQTSPMLATATELMVDMIARTVNQSDGSGPVRILEIGGGFGGTTKRLLEALQTTGVDIEYTFTDIAPTLVSRASKVFGHVKGMDFKTLNIETEPPSTLRGKYGIVLSTNCVHATSNRTETIRRIKSLLHPGGYMVLSEVTEIVDWYDVVYGLLEGWWLAHDGIYPLQPPEAWVQCFRAAGFDRGNIAVSEGPTRDLCIQRLLVASQKALTDHALPRQLQAKTTPRTVVYKEVDGVQIHADIYVPRVTTKKAMPIALMIHGGGHMTLSRAAIRPAQTEFLLANGILPVSLDYRLCPEVNLIDGPIADIRDAYLWAQQSLKSLVAPWDVVIDNAKIALIGWSTGGHLAMTTSWTVKELGVAPPAAILSFYGPTDFESGALDTRRAEEYPERQMSMSKIIESLPRQPITGYDSGKVDQTGLGWVKPGDPRSELVLSLFKEGNGLPLMLNGLPTVGESVVDDRTTGSSAFPEVDPAKVAAISPLAHVMNGTYVVPTFLVHGTEDELIPYDSARHFVGALRRTGVDCGLLTIPGARHIHDMDIKPGTIKWEGEVAPAYEFLMKQLWQ